jgi:hypothetical protein
VCHFFGSDIHGREECLGSLGYLSQGITSGSLVRDFTRVIRQHLLAGTNGYIW